MHLRFDRGTLLVDAPRASSAANLPGLVWDPRVQAFRAPALRYPELSRAFEDKVPPRRPLSYRWRPFELRPYQRAAVEAWEGGGHRGLIMLPTGSGKTRVALSAIERLGVPALCLVPTIALLEQWARVLEQAVEAPIGRLGDGAGRLEPITVATYESALRHMPRLGDRFGLLVIDEAHHFGAGRRDEALEMAIAPARLGLTATAPKEPAQLERLRLLIGLPVYERSIGDLAGTYLAPFVRRRQLVELSPDERVGYETRLATFQAFERAFRLRHPNYRWAELLSEAMNSPAGRRAIFAWREIQRLLAYSSAKRHELGQLLEAHLGSRILVFCADNRSAYAIARQHLLMPITCDIQREEREAAFVAFARGELRGLVSARVLNEGIDLPSADVAIVVSGAHGNREHIQRIGRILRPQEGKQAVLWELVARGTLEVGWARRRNDGVDSRTSVGAVDGRLPGRAALPRTG